MRKSKRLMLQSAKREENWKKVQDAEAAPTIEHNHLAIAVMRKRSEELREAEAAAELDLELMLSGRHATNSLGIHV